MFSFTHPSNNYDGTDRENRGDHDIWFLGYGSCVAGSPMARMKEVIGELIGLKAAGDDASTTYQDDVWQWCCTRHYQETD